MSKAKTWSEKDLKKIDSCVKEAVAAGKQIADGKREAAIYFGVTYNATSIRYGRWLKGLKGKKARTTKLPIIRKAREINSYKKKEVLNAVDLILGNNNRELTFDIKGVKVDLATKKLTIIY